MSRAKILVIEDNPSDIFFLRHALSTQEERFELEIISDGERALTFVRSQREDPQEKQPCAILLDLHLPKHHGLEVLRAIREEPVLSHIHVVVVAGATSPAEEAELRTLSADYRPKPSNLFELEELAAHLVAICKGLLALA